MPAFERPSLLRRAINSLRAQIYPHWVAQVSDDSRSSSVRELVEQIRDPRIVYEHNTNVLGAAHNIDKCFTPVARQGGDYGCLLEDDNFWMPGFLQRVANCLERSQWDLILANQRIYDESSGNFDDGTTRGDWFCPGPVEPISLRSQLFLHEGLSNGGLVWKLGGHQDLRVGTLVKETSLHEACRSLLVHKPFLFIEQADAVWSDVPKASTARAFERNRTFNRGMQAIRRYVLAKGGKPLLRCASEFAIRRDLLDSLVFTISYCGKPLIIRDNLAGRYRIAAKGVAKGYAIRLLEKNPCRDFLLTLERAAINSPSHMSCSSR